jgi:hypothetical protein
MAVCRIARLSRDADTPLEIELTGNGYEDD